MAKRPTSKYCSVRCRTAATRDRQKNGTAPAAPDVVVSAPSGVRVLASTRAKLEKAGLLETPEAAVALDVARRIESATDSALPALTREFSRLLEVAMSLAESEGDSVDEMQARRDAKRARAAAG